MKLFDSSAPGPRTARDARLTAISFVADATGGLNAKRNQQGHADNQRLAFHVANLDANATYALMAATRDNPTLTEVATFSTDASGNALVKYVKKNNGKVRVTDWPAGTPPILDVTSLAILDSGSNSVLSTTLP